MKVFAILLTSIVAVFSLASATRALTVDEIVKLKEAGVSDVTIELLIRRDTPSVGVWKENGWIVYSTESRLPHPPKIIPHPSEYPLSVYPQIDTDRRGRSR
jgi:hypothetical protein